MAITVRGARVHNLRGLDVSVPLRKFVAVVGVSGSGKSSLALGVLYAEGSRRYIEALSTYTRRRLAQASRAAVDSVEHVPAALALRQRPSVPGVRSTFGTSTELLNVLRLLFSRAGAHLCPNGHRQAPTIGVAFGSTLTCRECRVTFDPPGAESFAFNSEGACPRCTGIGIVREVDEAALVPDPSRSISEGAVAPWAMFGLTVMPQVVAEFGVRTDVPYAELTDDEQHIVMHGPGEKRQITVPSKSGKLFELNFTYRSARQAVIEALDNAESERGLSRIQRFLHVEQCPECQGTRLSPAARSTLVDGVNLATATAKTLEEVVLWARGVRSTLPESMHVMVDNIVDELVRIATRLLALGLGYLGLDRASSTLSTGERQRVQLARAVRNRTTGILYVLDEPSIGLHPSNVDGLREVVRELLEDGNSVVLVDHDVQVLRDADWLIEIGPGSGPQGGTIVATGDVAALGNDPSSLMGGFLTGREPVVVRERRAIDAVFDLGVVQLSTLPLHTVQAINLDLPAGRLIAITGVSGSGKSTLVLESLVPALQAHIAGTPLPKHVADLAPGPINRVNVVDATPIGSNVRSTVATYTGILDDLRRAYAATPAAQAMGLSASDFSYNTGSLRCPRCNGAGQVSLDVQFLPDVDVVCPECDGSRYAPNVGKIRRLAPGADSDDGLSLPALLALTVREALGHVGDISRVKMRLSALVEVGLGYLTLGEATPALSGGEAQRLKLTTELNSDHAGTLFVLDEPTIGLHPLDVRLLLEVLDRLTARGASVLVIEHDLDLIANADYVIDLGPGGGAAGGRIVATGSPDQLMLDQESVTSRYLRAHLARPSQAEKAAL